MPTANKIRVQQNFCMMAQLAHDFVIKGIAKQGATCVESQNIDLHALLEWELLENVTLTRLRFVRMAS